MIPGKILVVGASQELRRELLKVVAESMTDDSTPSPIIVASSEELTKLDEEFIKLHVERKDDPPRIKIKSFSRNDIKAHKKPRHDYPFWYRGYK